MSPGTRTLVRLSGALASRDSERIRVAMGEAKLRCEHNQVEEILLQAHLFLGFPAAVNALSAWREVSGLPAPPGREESSHTLAERGRDVCRRVYGSRYEDLRKGVAALHPDIDRWMVEDGYGKVLGREELPLKARELAIVGLLAVLDTPVQLYSHLRGALAVGASAAEVQEGLESVKEFMGPATADRAFECWVRVRDRADSHTGPRG